MKELATRQKDGERRMRVIALVNGALLTSIAFYLHSTFWTFYLPFYSESELPGFSQGVFSIHPGLLSTCGVALIIGVIRWHTRIHSSIGRRCVAMLPFFVVVLTACILCYAFLGPVMGLRTSLGR